MNKFELCYQNNQYIMMEGAIGERLKQDYHVDFDENVVMAGFVYDNKIRGYIKEYWTEYYNIASMHMVPFMATTPTRRVNSSRVNCSSFDKNIVKDNIDFLKDVRNSLGENMYVGYMLGSKGDAYTGIGCCDSDESYDFHKWEIELATLEEPDFFYAALLPSKEEALGISRCLSEYNTPYIISFTINEDGCLIDGTPISLAIQQIDSLVDRKPLCYMTNCVHPRIIYNSLMRNDINIIKKRFMGVQVNTADYPYIDLEYSSKIVNSTPNKIASNVKKLDDMFDLKILGGCCGTNTIYMDKILEAVLG
ncbi:MAG: homocysteine S-methyltransferase family protein [Lachnospiraceae bacterium]|nr:homocysteine S-methyltransferase family protein [Lachnospiraceae bacterium]